MDSKFDLADILKYVTLGLYFSFSISVAINIDLLKNGIALWNSLGLTESAGVIAGFVLLLLAYVIGIVVNTSKHLLSSSFYYHFYDSRTKQREMGVTNKKLTRKKREKSPRMDYERIQAESDVDSTKVFFGSVKKKEKTLYKILNAVGFVLYWLLRRDTIDETCMIHKRRVSLRKQKWLALCINPVVAMQTLSERIELKSGATKKTEYQVLGEMFQGLGFASLVTFLISAIIQLPKLVVGSLTAAFYPLLFLGAFIASVILACTMFSRFLDVLERCRQGLSLGISEAIGPENMQKTFICLRTRGDVELLQKALRSVVIQRDVALTLLVNCDNDSPEIVDKVAKYLDETNAKTGIRYSLFVTKSQGAAKAMFSCITNVRRISEPNDVVFFLDDDDEFVDETSLVTVVLRMARLNADVCLLPFRIDNKIEKNIVIGRGRFHNHVCEYLANLKDPLESNHIPNLEFAASMIWTKAQRSGNLHLYDYMLHKAIGKGPSENLTSYEDFPSFICLLFRGKKITGVSQKIYSYTKREGSITGTLEKNSFQVQRVGFLSHTSKILRYGITQDYQDSQDEFCRHSSSDIFCDDYLDLGSRFLFFKITEITGILDGSDRQGAHLLRDYDGTQFKHDVCSKIGIRLSEANGTVEYCGVTEA